MPHYKEDFSRFPISLRKQTVKCCEKSDVRSPLVFYIFLKPEIMKYELKNILIVFVTK